MNHSADSRPNTAAPPSSQVEHIEHPPVDRKASVTIMAVFIVLAVAAVVFGGNLLNPASSTTDGDYAGETVEVLIPLAEGGGTDTWARFVGTELTRYPAHPASSRSTKQVVKASRAPTGSWRRPRTTEPSAGQHRDHVGPRPVGGDVRLLTPILANGTGGVIYGRTESGIKSPEDLINRSDPLTFGGISATGLDLTTLVVFDLLGADVESIFGFEGRGPVDLALQEARSTSTTRRHRHMGPRSKASSRTATRCHSWRSDSSTTAATSCETPTSPTSPPSRRSTKRCTARHPVGRSSRRTRRCSASPTRIRRRCGSRTTRHPRRSSCCVPPLSCASPEFVESAAEVLGGYPLLAGEQLEELIGEAYTVDENVRNYVVELLETKYQIKLN